MDIELSLISKKFNKLDSNPVLFTLWFIDLDKLMLYIRRVGKKAYHEKGEKRFSYE